ncbi:MAG: transglutaminase-like domain-containing protein [Cyanobacteria bacterium P01_F01_bin.53]
MTSASPNNSGVRDSGFIDGASLCSLAIALWGYQTGLFFVALPIILILEGRRIIHQRWTLSFSDLREAAKLCVALVAILFVVTATVEKSVFIYTLFQWLPVAGLPLLIARTYGLGVSELLSQRFSSTPVPQTAQQHSITAKSLKQRSPINLYYLYFGTCLAAASAADSDHFFFYIGATLLTGLLLWPLRPKRSTPIVWLLLFCLSIGLGFAGHRQLAYAQQRLEAQVIAMIGDIASGGAIDPDGNTTFMGSVGRLKLSNKIAFRVSTDKVSADNISTAQAEPGNPFPLLLQEATYNQYQLSTWRADNSVFNDVPPGTEDGDWVLGQASQQDTTISISTDLERGDGILTLPRGTSTIVQLPVEEMQSNQYGAVQVNAKGTATYQVQFQPTRGTAETRPTATDLQIPNVDKAAIETVLTQLGLSEQQLSEHPLSESEIVSKIAAHFQDFQYSLDLLLPAADTAAVSDFLLNTQAGHCEYFASATALLLRGAGIPARYAVGYSVHEFSPLEGQYIVRSRDAHAWTLVYLDKRWQILDTTPSDWSAQEQAMTSELQALPDFFAFLGFQLSYRIRQLGELGLREVLMIVIPLFCYLLWRSSQVFQGQQKNTDPTATAVAGINVLPSGLDSELYQIEAFLGEQLSEQGLERLPSESFLQWCDRIQSLIPAPQRPSFKEILTLHYRYRFDPAGLRPTERQQLQQLSGQFKQQLALTLSQADTSDNNKSADYSPSL